MECMSLCGIPCLCALSASAFYISQISFQKSFYGDLFLFFLDTWYVCIKVAVCYQPHPCTVTNYPVVAWAAACSIKIVFIAWQHIVGQSPTQRICRQLGCTPIPSFVCRMKLCGSIKITVFCLRHKSLEPPSCFRVIPTCGFATASP